MGTGGSSSADFTASYQPAGIYGWRKQCLYAAILFLLILVIMNLAVTIWILRVFNFNIEGLHMGTIKISSDGVFIGGKMDVVKTLYANKLLSPEGAPLTIQSLKDVHLKSWGGKNGTRSSLNIGRNSVEAMCDIFEVRDPGGKSRLKVTDKEIIYGLDEITYSGKAIFDGCVETPNIRGPYTGSLRLESTSSSILLTGKDQVILEAPEGDIVIKSSQDITFQANGKMSLNASHVFLKNLYSSFPNSNAKVYDNVFQVCMCQNGRLFLAPSNGRCVTELDACL